MTGTLPHIRSFKGRRVCYETARAFDEVLAGLRAAVGVVPHDELQQSVHDCATNEGFVQRMQEIAGDSGFMLFFEMDPVRGSRRWKVVRWVFGNPVIAYTMLRHDIAAGLFAPIEFLLFENESGHGAPFDVRSAVLAHSDRG